MQVVRESPSGWIMATTKLQWYLTTYARLSNGGFELLTYASMPSLEVAQYKAQTELPNNEFYEVECRLGSLLPKTPKPCWVTRERYSHKPNVAQSQVEAELKAQRMLKRIHKADTLNPKRTMSNILDLKQWLTKPQYQLLLDALMSKPCVMKILYERGVM